ncbi:MAG TPA: ketopantoate reductase family protein [Candidatus Lokiarchaeia archaeon]|nr:ketopantoate reductase family protein [Candidatus Lokiarchaeia archaeon]
MPVIIVFGAGAVGSLFAHIISGKDTNEVHVVARQDHVAAMRDHGLIVHDYDGATETNFTIMPHETLEECPRADVAFVTAKTYQIPNIIKDFDALFGENMPPIVLLMNGLGLVEMAREIVPSGTFIRGIALSPSHFEPGEVWSTGGNLRYTFPLESRELLADLFPSTIDVLFSENFEEEEWRKTLLNAVMNPVAGILMGAVGPVLENPSLFNIVKGLIAEFREVAMARGINLGSLDEMIAYCHGTASKDPEHSPSLSQDLQRGKKTEIDAINGYIMKEGRRLSVPTPLHEAMITLVKFLEQLPRETG